MAEYLLQSILEKRKISDVLVESVGTVATEGNNASLRAVRQVWTAERIDMRPHKARRLKKNHIDTADIVIGMEQNHIDAITKLAPDARDKTELIGEYLGLGNGMELPDPYGGPEEYFAEVYELLKGALNTLADKLENGEEEQS